MQHIIDLCRTGHHIFMSMFEELPLAAEEGQGELETSGEHVYYNRNDDHNDKYY